jgi:hypothetical protein
MSGGPARHSRLSMGSLAVPLRDRQLAELIGELNQNKSIDITSQRMRQYRNSLALQRIAWRQLSSSGVVKFHDAKCIALGVLTVKHVPEFRQCDFWRKDLSTSFGNLPCERVDGTYVESIDG